MRPNTDNTLCATIVKFLSFDKSKTFIFLISITALLTYRGSDNIQAAQIEQSSQVFILMVDNNDPEQFGQLKASLEANSGQVTHSFPNRAVIAKVPSDAVHQLKSLPGVVEILTEAVDLANVDQYGAEARQLVSVWNTIINPPNEAGIMSHSVEAHFGAEEHAFIAPDLPPQGDMNLAAASSVTPGYYQTSEFMAGSIAVGVILLESDGSVDPSTENWTHDEKQLVFNEIVTAMNWWAELEPRANLSFVYDDHFTNPLPTRVEPITRPYTDQQYWIKDAMGALGYTSSSYFTRVRDYNNDLRDTHKTDWAFTIFVADSSNDADNRFSDGYFGYAYLGGPFMVMTYGNNGYGPYHMDAVAAHEMGHIFHALDQYPGALQGCKRKSGYLHVENQNSQYGNCTSNTGSIMRGQISPFNAKLIDNYGAGQIGWRDSDGDNIFDPMDTDLPVSIDTFSQTGNTIVVAGAANIVPFASPRRTDVTINKLTGVKYRFDDGAWQSASASDGKFDSTTENYQFSATVTMPGLHTLQVAAVDSAGNISENFATQSITILDPVDGGLNTEIDPLEEINSSSLTQIQGKAYHMEGGNVTQVEYRINGSAWQPALPLDGAFDSNYEEFTVGYDTTEPGSYLVEARAIDDQGHIEANPASRQVHVEPVKQTFMPLLVYGR